MPSDNDKVYAKKHKLNDLLNELYTTLTQEKPDNPIQYAIKHLEAKLPPSEKKKEPSLVNFKVTSPLNQSINNEKKEEADGADLLARVFNRNLLMGPGPSGNQEDKHERSKSNASFASAFPLANFNIMNKINRIIVKTNQELSPEEQLERERIVFIDKNAHDTNEQANSEPKMNISYKNDVKNRSILMKHKQELKELIEMEQAKQTGQVKDTEGVISRSVDPDRREKPDEAGKEKVLKTPRNERRVEREEFVEQTVMREEETNELENEILTADNYNRVTRKKKSKIPNKNNMRANLNQPQMTLGARNASIAPVVKLVICQICSKVQNQLNESEHTLLNEPTTERTIKAESAAKIPPVEDKVEKENDPPKENLEKSKLLDFFNTITPDLPLKTDRTNLDDEYIESASQVSGPRPITPYEPPTDRGLKEPTEGFPKETGVLAWLMSRQEAAKPEDDAKNQDKKSDILKRGSPTLVSPRPRQASKDKHSSSSTASSLRSNSKVISYKTSDRLIDESKKAKEDKSSELEGQRWNQKASSGSEMSSLTKHK